VRGGNAMKLPRRQFLHLAAAAATLPAVSSIAQAVDYPTRPVRLVVGYPPGLAPDIIARLIGAPLSERLGQPIVIDNRPGAGSNIGTEIVATAPPDGYTLIQVTSTNAFNATIYDNLTFNFIRDIAPVASIALGPFILVVNPAVPAKTIPEFIAHAKANPSKIHMASAGVGTAPHIFGELFNMMTGVDLVHVPYRSSYYPDLLGGQVQVVFATVTSSIGYIKAGQLRALGVTTATRAEALPDVPPIAESVPGYEASGWWGIGAPARTSTEIIEKLHKEVNAVVADPKMQASLVGVGVTPMSATPAEFGKFIADETAKWGKVVKFAGINPV
jgi:tripartite-type tricarboxylate transporter receptor subunit TctC